MNPLRFEVDRLYGTGPGVLSLAASVGWSRLSAVWQGVQADLELPAPGIAVSGVDALQLWFAFDASIAIDDRLRFLQGLRGRYLPDVAASKIGMTGSPAAPCVEVRPQQWSAFVSQDLASLFDETPWLDFPPNEEGQASLLRALRPIPPGAFAAALAQLGGNDEAPTAPSVAGNGAVAGPAPGTDPARFLAGVMNDAAAPLALRIEAARILLLSSSPASPARPSAGPSA